MIDVKKVEDFEKLTDSLNSIATAIENMPAPTGGGIDYSTEEQDTGIKWLDGRKIYQKTYNNFTTDLVNGWTNDLCKDDNTEIIKVVDFFLIFSSDNTVIPALYNRSSSDYSTWLIEPDKHSIQLYSMYTSSTARIYNITIQYVKVGE